MRAATHKEKVVTTLIKTSYVVKQSAVTARSAPHPSGRERAVNSADASGREAPYGLLKALAAAVLISGAVAYLGHLATAGWELALYPLIRSEA